MITQGSAYRINFPETFTGALLILFPAAILLTVLIVSCREENEPVPDESRIIIGDYHFMSADSTVRIIEASYNDFEEILLDVDADSTADLRLVLAMYGSPGMGISYLSHIECLQEGMALHGIFTQDTTFLRQVIEIFSDDYNLYKAKTDYYSCRRESGEYSALEYETAFHAMDLDPGDTLRLSDTYSSDTVSFIYQWDSPVLTYPENDTVFINSSHYKFDCYSFPYGIETFLGFRLTGEPDRLGWVRLIPGSENRMTLMEYAVQQ